MPVRSHRDEPIGDQIRRLLEKRLSNPSDDELLELIEALTTELGEAIGEAGGSGVEPIDYLLGRASKRLSLEAHRVAEQMRMAEEDRARSSRSDPLDRQRSC